MNPREDMKNSIRRVKFKLYDILEEPTGLDTKIANISLTLLIALNVLAVILETVDPIYQKYVTWFTLFEQFSMTIFLIEYILRVWISDLDPIKGKDKFRRLKYMLSPSAILDLLVIFPFILPFVIADLRMTRMIRFFRVFRIFKLVRYNRAAHLLADTFKEKKEALLVTAMTAGMVLLFSASALYYTEHESQPDKFSSIPASLWVAVITLTSVGYGDAYPVTPLGKVLGGFVAVAGLGMVALPTGILATGFADTLAKDKKVREKTKEKCSCPHCGKEINKDA